MAGATSDPGVSVCFKLKIDNDHDLGAFVSVEGLSMEVVVEQREEGGNNLFVHQLPGRVKYTNIKLTRPVNADSVKVQKWLSTMTKHFERSTAELSAVTLDEKVVATWKLHGVIPVKWQGPSFSAESPKVAIETLELAHHGFLP